MKYVLVTGAGGGMGKATVDAFAKHGFTVFAADRVLCEARENVIPLRIDVTDAVSVSAAFDTVKTVTPHLSYIIHLAGIYVLDSLVETDAEIFEKIFNVNVGGVFLINKTFLPLLSDGSGIIAVTSELAVRDPLPFTGLYGITKTALDKYAYSLRMELQLLGINVSVLRAGAVDTGMIGESTDQLDAFCRKTALYPCNAKRFRNIVDKVEARRIPPEKVAAKLYRISEAKHPRFAYSINRNPLLILFDKLPKSARFSMIRSVLRDPEKRTKVKGDS